MLISITSTILILSISTSSTMDEPLTSMLRFMENISLLYYLLYYFTVGMLAYIGYHCVVGSRKIKEHMALYFILFFAVLLVSPILLFTNPLPAETYYIAPLFHIDRYGIIVGGRILKYKIVGHFFGSIFALMTSIDTFLAIRVVPMITWVLIALLLYVSLRHVVGYKLAFIGPLYFISGN